MKPNKEVRKQADHFIAFFKAFKRGEQIQRKTQYDKEWQDIDLGDLISEFAVQYRRKPTRK